MNKWYWWTYLQGRNKEVDVESGLDDMGWEGEAGAKWE